MADTPQDPVTQLLNHFIRLRQTGTSRDEAWYTVLEEAEKNPQIEEKHVHRLLALAKNWEKREGYQYQYRSRGDAHKTLVGTPAPKPDSVIRPLAPRPTAPPTTMLNPETLKQYEEAARQQRQNPITINEPPTGSPDTSKLNPIDTSMLEKGSFFPPDAKVVMYFRDFPDHLVIEIPADKEVIIGRVVLNSAITPDIDLTRFNAGHYGVSRMHAVMERRENTLVIADLGSANHTYLNGERLHPNELRVLRDGDQISFARLLTQIHFR